LATRAIRLYGANGSAVVYGTAVRTRITETVTQMDTDEQKRKAGNHALGITALDTEFFPAN